MMDDCSACVEIVGEPFLSRVRAWRAEKQAAEDAWRAFAVTKSA